MRLKGQRRCDKKEEDIATEKERLGFDVRYGIHSPRGHNIYVVEVTTFTLALLIRRCEHMASLSGLGGLFFCVFLHADCKIQDES